MAYDLQVLKMGQCEVPGPEVYWMSHWNSWEMLYFWMVLLRGNGKNIIINTGPPPDLSPLNKVWSEAVDPRSQFVRRPEERPERLYAVTVSLRAISTTSWSLHCRHMPLETSNYLRMRPFASRARDGLRISTPQSLPCTSRESSAFPTIRSSIWRSKRRRNFACWKTKRKFCLGFTPSGQAYITALRWHSRSRPIVAKS
jgi:hypothetical protein